MATSPRTKPKRKFSLLNLKARFANRSEQELANAAELNRFYPVTPGYETQEWDPSRLVDEGYPTPSPSVASSTSVRAEKGLPPPPPPKLYPDDKETARPPTPHEVVLVSQPHAHSADPTTPSIHIAYDDSSDRTPGMSQSSQLRRC